MKKLSVIGLAMVIVVVCLLLHWQHVKISKFDTDFRQQLAGTWSTQLDNMRLTNAVMPDGSFTCYLIFIHSRRTNSYQETGTWIVQDGHLIETVKSDTNPTALTPRSHGGSISHVDTSKFTVRWQGSPDEWVWQKVTE